MKLADGQTNADKYPAKCQKNNDEKRKWKEKTLIKHFSLIQPRIDWFIA